MKMFEVTYKRRLNSNMVWLKIYAPLVARKARPGQFIILRTDEYGERIPLTMAGHDEKDGTIDLIYAAVGRTTMLMDQLEVGDCFADIVGPLGKPTHMEGLKKVCVVGGEMCIRDRLASRMQLTLLQKSWEFLLWKQKMK